MRGPVRPNRVKVTEAQLRERFNRDVQPRIDNGTYYLNVRSEPLAPPDANQQLGARSTMFEVLNQQGQKVALAHVYVNPDGSYGGSGRLDPKLIKSGQITYFV